MKLNVETEPWGVVRIDLVKVCTSPALSRNSLLLIGTIAPSDGPRAGCPPHHGPPTTRLPRGRRRPPHLLRGRESPVHGAVEHLGARRPAGARAGRDPRRPRPGHPHRRRPGRGRRGAAGSRPSWTPCGPTLPRWAPRSPATCAWASSRPPPAGCSPASSPRCRPATPRCGWWSPRPPRRRCCPSWSPGRSTPRCSPCRSTIPSWASSRSSTRTSCWWRRPATRSPIASRSPWPRSPSTACCCRRPARRCATPSTSPRLARGVRLCATAEIDGVRLIASLVLDGHGAGIVPFTTVPSNLALAKVITIRDLPRRQVGVVRRRGVQLSTPSHVVLDILQEVLRIGTGHPRRPPPWHGRPRGLVTCAHARRRPPQPSPWRRRGARRGDRRPAGGAGERRSQRAPRRPVVGRVREPRRRGPDRPAASAFRWCASSPRAAPTSTRAWPPSTVGAGRRGPSPTARASCRSSWP